MIDAEAIAALGFNDRQTAWLDQLNALVEQGLKVFDGTVHGADAMVELALEARARVEAATDPRDVFLPALLERVVQLYGVQSGHPTSCGCRYSAMSDLLVLERANDVHL